MSIEVWFFSTSYTDLINMRDWKGILLKAHINWLGQEITHCGLRVNLDIDMMYQATWNGLLAFELNSLLLKPAYVIDVTDKVNSIDIIDNIQKIFVTQCQYGVTLKNLLHLMFRKPNKVSGILCTSFVLYALGIEYIPMDLYPDKCYELLEKYASSSKTLVS